VVRPGFLYEFFHDLIVKPGVVCMFLRSQCGFPRTKQAVPISEQCIRAQRAAWPQPWYDQCKESWQRVIRHIHAMWDTVGLTVVDVAIDVKPSADLLQVLEARTSLSLSRTQCRATAGLIVEHSKVFTRLLQPKCLLDSPHATCIFMAKSYILRHTLHRAQYDFLNFDGRFCFFCGQSLAICPFPLH
jgi:hypothetical protein